MIEWRQISDLLDHSILPPLDNIILPQFNAQRNVTFLTNCIGHMVTEWKEFPSKLQTMFSILSKSEKNVCKGKYLYIYIYIYIYINYPLAKL